MGLSCLKLNQNDSSVLKQAGSLLNYKLNGSNQRAWMTLYTFHKLQQRPGQYTNQSMNYEADLQVPVCARNESNSCHMPRLSDNGL